MNGNRSISKKRLEAHAIIAKEITFVKNDTRIFLKRHFKILAIQFLRKYLGTGVSPLPLFGGTILIVFKYFKFVYSTSISSIGIATLWSRMYTKVEQPYYCIYCYMFNSIQFNYVCVAMFIH